MEMKNVRAFVERMLHCAEDATTSESVLNFRAQAFGVIMFAQKFIPYDELGKYWEDEGIWQKFNDIAREKRR